MTARRGAQTRTCLIVMAEDGSAVHLAIADRTEPVPRSTLCEAAVVAGQPTARFQERGCRRCAEVGLDLGIVGLRDHGATISLPRFYARTGGRRGSGNGVPRQPPPAA